MSNSRYEWFILTIASWYCNATLVPLYNTLGQESILHIMKLTEMQVVFVNSESLPTFGKISNCNTMIKTFVVFDDNFGPLDGYRFLLYNEMIE